MSFMITLNGHSNEPHNDAVKRVFENAVRALRKIPGISLGGTWSSGDLTGVANGTAPEVPDESPPMPEPVTEPEVPDYGYAVPDDTAPSV